MSEERPDRPPTKEETALTVAKTESIKQETENSKKQGERNDAEAAKLLAEARVASAQAEVAEIMAAREYRKERNELAKDLHHHRYQFSGRVDADSVGRCIDQFSTWERQADGEAPLKVEIVINSPGGSIVDGFALVDYLIGLRAQGHQITTHSLGMAASMGGVLLQAGTERVMSPNSFLLLHEGSLGTAGDFGNVKDFVHLMETMHEHILDLFVERAKPINPKTTKAFIKTRWQRTDWWIDAKDALRYGFVDSIR